MKILFLTHSLPYPTNDGVKLYSYNLLKQLGGRHKVTLLSLIESESEKEFTPKLRNFCCRIETVVKKIPKSAFLRLWNTLFQKMPFCIYQFYSREFAKKLCEVTKKEQYDIVHFEFVNTSIYRKFAAVLPSVYFPYDAMSMLFYKNVSGEHNLLKKLYTYLQYRKMKAYERRIISKFPKTVVVSPIDKRWLLSLSPDLDITVIPYGVDAEYFKPEPVEKDYPSVIFRGKMDFLPNIDAAIYFCEQILPFIKEHVPNVKFYIVGRNPTKEVQKLAKDKSVTIVSGGSVEDIKRYTLKCTVSVCPMRIGSGLKIKVLESMALDSPIVATRLACDGIPDAKDGKHIFFANAPQEFANRVLMLMKDERLRREVSQNARRFVMEKYTWERAAQMFESVYKEARIGHSENQSKDASRVIPQKF